MQSRTLLPEPKGIAGPLGGVVGVLAGFYIISDLMFISQLTTIIVAILGIASLITCCVIKRFRFFVLFSAIMAVALSWATYRDLCQTSEGADWWVAIVTTPIIAGYFCLVMLVGVASALAAQRLFSHKKASLQN